MSQKSMLHAQEKLEEKMEEAGQGARIAIHHEHTIAGLQRQLRSEQDQHAAVSMIGCLVCSCKWISILGQFQRYVGPCHASS